MSGIPEGYDAYILIRNLPTEIKKKFKMECVLQNVTMTEAVEMFMRKVVNKEIALEASNERRRVDTE